MVIKLIPNVDILRLQADPDHGTFGKMKINKAVFADTLEPYDRENKSFISSIPALQYICRRTISPKFGETFEICDVTDRDNVLFHWGNFDDDTNACVVTGNGIGIIGKRRAVLNSKDTFKEFMNIMAPYDEFILTISEHY